MQENQQPDPMKKPGLVKKKQVLKKLDQESAKLLQIIKDKINKKPHGRKIRDYEVIAKGLALIENSHISELQAKTMSEKDHLNLAHESYQKKTGKTSMDQEIKHFYIKRKVNFFKNKIT